MPRHRICRLKNATTVFHNARNGTTAARRVQIQPSASNGLAVPSVALVFQLGACDVARISTRLGSLDQADLVAVRNLAKRLQMLP